MRFVHQQPQYETTGQASNFLPEEYARGAAPRALRRRLRQRRLPVHRHQPPGDEPGHRPVPRAELDRRDRRDRPEHRRTSTNGVFAAGQGITKTAFQVAGGRGWRRASAWPTTSPASRRIVLRGGAGLFFDRPERQLGLRAGPQSAEPAERDGALRAAADARERRPHDQTPPALNVFEYDSDLPSSIQWNGGCRWRCRGRWRSTSSYVGQHQYDILQNMDINRGRFRHGVPAGEPGPDAGRQHHAGATAVVTDLMRAFRGYSSITQTTGWQERTYHSLQLSLQRRFRNGLSFGFNDTIGLYDRQNTTPRLQHAATGSFVDPGRPGRGRSSCSATTTRRPTSSRRTSSGTCPTCTAARALLKRRRRDRQRLAAGRDLDRRDRRAPTRSATATTTAAAT